MKKFLVGAVMAALVGATLTHRAQADTASATCAVRKDGDKQKGKSGPCTFGQRQGYIDIDLKNGDTISLSPVGDGPGKYEDQNGNKVTRTSATTSGMDFKWENGKKLTVTYVSSGGGGGEMEMEMEVAVVTTSSTNSTTVGSRSLEGPELLHQLQRPWPVDEHQPGLQRQADPAFKRGRARPRTLIRGGHVCSEPGLDRWFADGLASAARACPLRG